MSPIPCQVRIANNRLYIEESSEGGVLGIAFHVSIEDEGVLNDEGFISGLRSKSGDSSRA